MSTLQLPVGRDVRLDDRYLLEQGPVLMTGLQAVVRVLFEQMRRDHREGLRTATLISGYPGSPLAGLDLELSRQRELCDELEIVHRPGLNEDLAATSVWGSQLAPGMARARVDGVLGVWYGKAPGVDRSGDAFRHGNHGGAHPRGGLLAICGDDVSCKSSTLPSASEATLAALRMPVLYPGSPAEVLELGLHAIAASRASGTWVGLKLAANVADAVATVAVQSPVEAPSIPEVEWEGGPYVHRPSATFVPPVSQELERTLVGPRLELVRAYARLNEINRILGAGPGARLGIVAGGVVYQELREGLGLLGVTDADLERLGLRLLKLGMPWPLDREVIREFARGLDTVLVFEEKGSLVETAIRSHLFDLDPRPRVLGELDEEGAPMVADDAVLDAAVIAPLVGRHLLRHAYDPALAARIEGLAPRALALLPSGPARTPFFCSGCPHNRSTDVPEGATVGAGIGCHGMVVINPEGKGDVTGVTQMGGEGAQWIGQAPFTETPHIFQNLGDGTFTHSGSLAIRAAVAAGVNITYKLFYNEAVAMTGGQQVRGAMPVPELTRWLELEGVRRVIVTAAEPERYRGVKLAGIAELRPRSELTDAQRELSREPGVTVLIHDQACAAELRRLRKRGEAHDPPRRIAINERVCEGCGDCGRKSHCLSVLPVDTEFGPRTRIQQASCNKDYSCLDGDCPSFLTVIPGKRSADAIPAAPSGLPQPDLPPTGEGITLRLMGIGGTGVTTVAQVLAMAALLDGKRTTGLDQTGLAQKGGQVTSDVRFLDGARERASKATAGTVDGYLVFDLLAGAGAANLSTAKPGRTVAVLSTSPVPTGRMIGDPSAAPSASKQSLEAIDLMTTPDRNVRIDSLAVCERLFGDPMPANSLILGAAWQRGLIPVSLDAIEEAFRLNGVAIEKNIAAFGWGRTAVSRPERLASATADAGPSGQVDLRAKEIVAGLGAASESDLEELFTSRVSDLIAYQGLGYAERYAEFVERVIAAERGAGGGEDVSRAVATNLHKLMAYKDEYEVARLHLDPAERRRLRAEFGEDAKFRYQLHPPVLRALGMKRKLSLGAWFDPAFGLLRAMRRLRGTPLDAFGWARVRRVERALPGEYRDLVERALPELPRRPELVLEVCELPDLVRGYEGVKLENVERFRERAAELQTKLAAGTERSVPGEEGATRQGAENG